MDYDRRRRRNYNTYHPPRLVPQDQQNNVLPVPQHQLGQYQFNAPNQEPLQQPNNINNQIDGRNQEPLQQPNNINNQIDGRNQIDLQPPKEISPQLQKRINNDEELIQELSNDGYIGWSGYGVWMGVDPHEVGEQSWQEGKGKIAIKHRQGWKLHVSVNPDQTIPLMQAIKPLLQNLNVAHKFSEKYAEDPGSYSGKFVTIYLNNWKNDLNLVMNAIEPVVSQFQGGQVVQNELQLGNTNQISTRYGSFTHDQYIQNPQGKPEQDERTKIIPEWKEQELNEMKQWNEIFKK